MLKLPRGIRKEPGLLLRKSFNSIILAVELFNRPWDTGRSDGVLIFLDHSLEMLLKAGILHRGGRIRDPGTRNTVGFETCVNRALSNSECKFLYENDALTLTIINALRGAAQHHISDIAEEQLYLHMQSGLTLYRDVVRKVFGIDIADYLPRRVLPVSAMAFSGIEALFDRQVDEVRKLLTPGRRRRQEAKSTLRPLAIMDQALQGDAGQPSDRELDRLLDRIKKGEDWRVIFLGVNLVECAADGEGASISLRISKKEGIPMRIVNISESNEGIIGIKRVNELYYYNLSPKQMAEHLGQTLPRFTALRRHLKLEENPEYFKLIPFGTQHYKRFSQKGLAHARKAVQELTEDDLDRIWAQHGPGKRRRVISF